MKRIAITSLLTGLLTAATPANAVDLEEQLRICAALSFAEDRARCYDAVVAGLPAEQRADASADTSSAPTTPAPPATPAESAPAATASTDIQSDTLATGSPPAAEPQAEADPEDTFGQEHWETRRTTADALSATISDVQKDSYGSLIVTLDNGQVWQQKGYERYTLNTGDEVTISRGRLNSFFLNSGKTNRKVRFFRVK